MKKQMTTGHYIGIAGAVILAVASFLPWAKIEAMGYSETLNGIGAGGEMGDGVIQIGFAVIALILLLLRVKPWIPLIFGILAAIVGLVDFVNISSVNAETEGVSTLGYGLYLIQLGWIGIVAGSIMALVQGKGENKKEV